MLHSLSDQLHALEGLLVEKKYTTRTVMLFDKDVTDTLSNLALQLRYLGEEAQVM